MSTPTVDSAKEYAVVLKFFLKDDQEDSNESKTWAEVVVDRRQVETLNSGPHKVGSINTLVSNKLTGTWKSLIFQDRVPGSEPTDQQVKPETVIALMRQLSSRERSIVTRAVTDAVTAPSGGAVGRPQARASPIGRSQSKASGSSKKTKKAPPPPSAIPKSQAEKDACKLQASLIAERKAFCEKVGVQSNPDKRVAEKISALSDDAVVALCAHDDKVRDIAEECLRLRNLRRKDSAGPSGQVISVERQSVRVSNSRVLIHSESCAKRDVPGNRGVCNCQGVQSGRDN
jgi:hypothetical protein